MSLWVNIQPDEEIPQEMIIIIEIANIIKSLVFARNKLNVFHESSFVVLTKFPYIRLYYPHFTDDKPKLRFRDIKQHSQHHTGFSLDSEFLQTPLYCDKKHLCKMFLHNLVSHQRVQE